MEYHETRRRPVWWPYAVGAGIGVLSWAVFRVVDQPIGMSTAISQVAAVPLLPTGVVESNSYWAKTAPKWDYATLFLIGTFLGALGSALVTGTFRIERVPAVWREQFGPSVAHRYLAAFAGGVIALYGARMAGGCTSGHGISGTLQLAMSSWIFFITMFVAGVLAAWFMFGLAPSWTQKGGAR